MKQSVKKIIVAFTVIPFIFACNSQTNESHDHTDESHAHHHDEGHEHIHDDSSADDHDHQHHEDRSEVTLNNGEKWKANPETTEGVHNMLLLINNLSQPEESESYTILKLNLESEYGQIFKKCSMTGEAHEQLHNYLFPLKALFSGLESEFLSDQKAAMEQIRTHIRTYPDYFE